MSGAPFGKQNVTKLSTFGSRTVDFFQKLEKIGEGTYGQVFKAVEKATGEIVALKRIRMDNKDEGFPMTAIREINLLKKLSHANIVKLREVVTSIGPENDDQVNTDGNIKKDSNIYMVFEYMDHDLAGLMNRMKHKFTVPQIKCYMQQLLTGLHYCHIHKVLHRDIKAANLLINNEGVLKIADFGLARSLDRVHNNKLTNNVITLWYRPPELLLGETNYGTAVDMWSVGCIFAELLCGKPILNGRTEAEQINKVFELCGTPDEVIWPGVSKLPLYNQYKANTPMVRNLRHAFRCFDQHSLNLLDKMLTLDPTQRISAKDALDAEYFWTDPRPSDPKSLPQYESSHDFLTRMKMKHETQKNKQLAMKNKLEYPVQHTLPPSVQHTDTASHSEARNQHSNASQPVTSGAPGPGHYYNNPRESVPSRYQHPSGGYNNPNTSSRAGGYTTGSYLHQVRGPCTFNAMPGAPHPRGQTGGYQTYQQSNQFEPSNPGRGSTPNQSSRGGGYTRGSYMHQVRGPPYIVTGILGPPPPPCSQPGGYQTYQQSNQFAPSNRGRGSNPSGNSRNQMYRWH